MLAVLSVMSMRVVRLFRELGSVKVGLFLLLLVITAMRPAGPYMCPRRVPSGSSSVRIRPEGSAVQGCGLSVGGFADAESGVVEVQGGVVEGVEAAAVVEAEGVGVGVGSGVEVAGWVGVGGGGPLVGGGLFAGAAGEQVRGVVVGLGRGRGVGVVGGRWW